MSAAFAGRLFASAKRWLRPSFLFLETLDTPGQQAAGVPTIAYYIERHDWRDAAHRLIGYGAEALRYADPREARLHAARSIERADVCLRSDGLRLRPYRQCAAGDRF